MCLTLEKFCLILKKCDAEHFSVIAGIACHLQEQTHLTACFISYVLYNVPSSPLDHEPEFWLLSTKDGTFHRQTLKIANIKTGTKSKIEAKVAKWEISNDLIMEQQAHKIIIIIIIILEYLYRIILQ